MEARKDPRREPLAASGKSYVVRNHFAVVVFLALLLGAALTPGWPNAWLVAGVVLAIKSTSALVLLKLNPAVLNVRGAKPEMSARERAFFLVFIVASLGLPIVAGLDAGASSWTHESALELGIGLLMMVTGGSIDIWAMAENAFFATTVRIQENRDHQVCKSGPYAYVRHPGYMGLILAYFSLPFILGSRWSLVPAAIASLALVVRTVYEDRMLRAELAGYEEYASATRYRLLPFVW